MSDTKTEQEFFVRYLPGEKLFEYRYGDDGAVTQVLEVNFVAAITALYEQDGKFRRMGELLKLLGGIAFNDPGKWIEASSAPVEPGQAIIGKI